jgi:hypothetical protein
MLLAFSRMTSLAKTGVAIAVATAFGAGMWSETALADSKPPGDVAAIAQYVEAQPTLGGPRVASPGTTTPKTRETPATAHAIAQTARAIAEHGRTDKAALSNLTASNPPVASTPAATRHGVLAPHGTALGGVVQSTGLSYDNVVELGGLLVLISLACGAAAARRRAHRRTPPTVNP